MRRYLFSLAGLRALLRQQRGTALVEFALVFPFLFILIIGGAEVTRYILISQNIEKATGVLSSIITQEERAVAASASAPASGITVAEVNTNVFPNLNNALGGFGCCSAVGTDSVAAIITSLYKYEPADGKPGCTAGTEPACIWVQWQIGYVVPGASSAGEDGEWTSAITGIPVTQRGTMLALCDGARNCRPPALSGGTLPLTAADVTQIQSMVVHENMIVTETFYQYRPLLSPLLLAVTPSSTTPGFAVGAAALSRRVFGQPRNGPLKDLPPDFPVL